MYESQFHLQITPHMPLPCRDVTDFESIGFRRFFTNLNPSHLLTHFLSDSDLIFEQDLTVEMLSGLSF